MIVVDTSAIVAMLFNEADAHLYGKALAVAGEVRISALTDYEIRVVLGPRGEAFLQRYDDLLAEIEVILVDFDQSQSQAASHAYRRWGKGHHPAALNLGDCASYALAKSLDAPLLFKGADFSRTDVRRAI